MKITNAIALLFLSISVQAEEIPTQQSEQNIEQSNVLILRSEGFIKSSEALIAQIEKQNSFLSKNGVRSLTIDEREQNIKHQKLILEEYNKIQVEQEIIRVESSKIQTEQEKIIQHFIIVSTGLDKKISAILD